MFHKKLPDRDAYNAAFYKFEQCHNSAKGAFEEYVLFSKFIYGIFIKNKDMVVTSKNFRDVNLELMYHIRNKVEKHPWIFKKFFMVK